MAMVGGGITCRGGDAVLIEGEQREEGMYESIPPRDAPSLISA